MSALPTKDIPIQFSMLGVAARVLESMGTNETVSSLWEQVKIFDEVRTFDRYADALTLLFAGNLIVLEKGVLRRGQASSNKS